MRVMVTGAGALLGQGIIRSLRASRLAPHVIAVDPSPLAPALYWADTAHLVPMADAPDYLDRLREVIDRERPDVVIPGTDVELGILAQARESIEAAFDLTLIVSSPEVVRIADDKWLTSLFLQRHGLGYVPSCLPGDEDALIADVGFPLVVKPRVGARSIGVSVVRDRAELEHALATRSNIVIQKCVGTDDTEFTAGTLMFDGRCEASIVMRRDLRDGNTFRAFVDAYPELNAVMRATAEHLGAFGPANFQFRLDNGIPRIFEINARFSGTTWLRAQAGFNEVEMAIRHLTMGAPILQPEIRPLVLLRHWGETVVSPEALLTPAERLVEGTG